MVLPQHRGTGVAEELLQEIKLYGKKYGRIIIRWITKRVNYRAQKDYDKVATKTDWKLYEMDCM